MALSNEVKASRYWNEIYNINGKDYKFCSQLGGRKPIQNGLTRSQREGEKFLEYFKNKNILLEKYQNIEQSSGLSKSHIDELRKNLQEKQREFSKNCKINNKFAMNVFLLKGIDTNTAYLGGTYNVSFKNFKMEKTENGWIFKY